MALFGFGGSKSVKPIDITDQIAQVKGNAQKGRARVDELYNTLQPLTEQYKNEATGAIGASKAAAGLERTNFLKANEDLTSQTKDLLRQNLYADTFTGLPDTLRAVREASAAGSGIDSGAYQQAVQNVGRDTAANIVGGERDIQLKGLEGQQNAQQVAYQTFSNLSSKLDDQQLGLLTKVLDTGREDQVRRTAQQLGLDESETQSLLDLMNFKASGQLASESADAANASDELSALLGLGGTVVGGMYGGPKGAAIGGQVGRQIKAV